MKFFFSPLCQGNNYRACTANENKFTLKSERKLIFINLFKWINCEFLFLRIEITLDVYLSLSSFFLRIEGAIRLQEKNRRMTLDEMHCENGPPRPTTWNKQKRKKGSANLCCFRAIKVLNYESSVTTYDEVQRWDTWKLLHAWPKFPFFSSPHAPFL